MLEHQETLIHEDVMKEEFVCNLSKCHGACCVQGNAGAPLEEDELKQLEAVYPIVKPYLTRKGIATIEKEGLYVRDFEGDQRSEEHTSELQSRENLVCRLLLEKTKIN